MSFYFACMKRIVLALFVLLVCQNAFGEIIIDKLPEINYRNADGTNYIPDATRYPKINEIENSIFGQNFSNEPIEIRLNRIEQKLFKREFSSNSLYDRMEKIVKNVDEASVSSNDKKTLASLEKKFFGKNYTNDTIQTRTLRLEQEILGAAQNNSNNLSKRIEMLKTASNNSYSPVQNYGFYNNQGLKNKIKNAFNNTRGTMTGFSPSCDPYFNNFAPNFNKYWGQNSSQNYYQNYGQNYAMVPNMNYQNSMSNYSQQNQSFYYPNTNKGNFRNIWGDDTDGATYWSNGEYFKNKRSNNAGVGVTIID